MGQSAAASFEVPLGRPRRFKDEPSESITARVPASVGAHLAKRGPTKHIAAGDALVFEKELSERLEAHLQALLFSAAHQTQDYGSSRAETLARLVVLGLAAERVSADPKRGGKK